MKITQTRILIDQGNYTEKTIYHTIIKNVEDAILKVTWPLGSDVFTVKPVKNGNGVKPIKQFCMQHLFENGWRLEHRLRVSSSLSPGPLDATIELDDGRHFAIEWETGNISSSHRAINKIALGILNGTLAGGILILPSRPLYHYLTDRVGNYAELEPYFPVWSNLSVADGFLAVIEIQHDAISFDVPLIPKGTDGWANYMAPIIEID